jgi:hypothetical protein
MTVLNKVTQPVSWQAIFITFKRGRIIWPSNEGQSGSIPYLDFVEAQTSIGSVDICGYIGISFWPYHLKA